MSAPLMAKKTTLALGWWDYHLLNGLKSWVNRQPYSMAEYDSNN
jgi:hypothetical protein